MTGERPPVRDVHGFAVHRVRVGLNEVTCLECGEVFSLSMWRGCPRCNRADPDGGKMRVTATVPTTAYLRPEEMERV